MTIQTDNDGLSSRMHMATASIHLISAVTNKEVTVKPLAKTDLWKFLGHVSRKGFLHVEPGKSKGSMSVGIPSNIPRYYTPYTHF